MAESPNTILSVDNGFTQVLYQPQDAIAIETIWFGEKVITPAGTSGDTTISYRNPQDNNGWAVQIGLPGVEVPPIDPLPGFDNVFQMIRRGGCTWAHRGGSSNWPEMSEYAYDQAVLAGYSALEFSAQRTSDGVWVGCHDIDLNRTSQTTGLPNISTMTWAQVQTYMNSFNSGGTPRPYYRLIDFLDKYTPTHVCIVDPKNAVSFRDEFL
ncbi:MAG: glycerophosphodiester phosphodiesterase family protein, partial [Aurantimicrobium sp.]|uniref:glycerophosphodiester phosphodiesterase n=1 Tax=Aurantimicrobium sp. TaxID=1930784 RepID=UPI002FC8F19D